mgnify:CR=1 FL=1
MLTRVFKSGNSLAVRFPKELGFLDAAQDVEVERVGNTLVLRLVEEKNAGGHWQNLLDVQPRLHGARKGVSR